MVEKVKTVKESKCVELTAGSCVRCYNLQNVIMVEKYVLEVKNKYVLRVKCVDGTIGEYSYNNEKELDNAYKKFTSKM